MQVGFLNADVMPELSSYETDSWVRYKWDTIQVRSYHHQKHQHHHRYHHRHHHRHYQRYHHDSIFSVSSLAAEVMVMLKDTQTGSTPAWGEQGLTIMIKNKNK